MRQVTCPREGEALKAVRTGIWEEALTTHMAGCAVCKEIVQASNWMRALARSSEKTPELPDASLLWWRAQLSEKQEKAEKAQELAEWLEIISATIISAGVAAWIDWNWYAVQTLMTSFLTDVWPQIWINASSVINTTPILYSLGAVILSFIAIVLAFPLLERD